jgi:hypothetical protein
LATGQSWQVQVSSSGVNLKLKFGSPTSSSAQKERSARYGRPILDFYLGCCNRQQALAWPLLLHRRLDRGLNNPLAAVGIHDFTAVAAAIAAVAAVVPAVATIATMAAVAAVATMVTVAAVTVAAAVAGVAIAAMMTTAAAVVIAGAAIATATAAEQAGFGLAVTAHEGNAHQAEKQSHTQNNNAVHPRILQMCLQVP